MSCEIDFSIKTQYSTPEYILSEYLHTRYIISYVSRMTMCKIDTTSFIKIYLVASNKNNHSLYRLIFFRVIFLLFSVPSK